LLAVKSLVALKASEACISAIDSNGDLAFWAMSYMHDQKMVNALITKLSTSQGVTKRRILRTLVRLYNREKFYDGSWWWKTRPDTRGPYYKMETWSGSAAIKNMILKINASNNAEMKSFVASLMSKDRVDLNAVDAASRETKIKSAGIDYAKINSKQGAVGKMALEDIIIAMNKTKGKIDLGIKVFKQQGCIGCHSINPGDELKGPHLGQIGAIHDREGLIMDILRPNHNISQGFPTMSISTKNGKSYIGFISKETADDMEIRDMAGKIYTVPMATITSKKEVHGMSMIPPGLANALSIDELASLLTYLQSKKK